jgi:hypothetical protein
LHRPGCAGSINILIHRALGALSPLLAFIFVFAFLICPEARADVGVILNDSLDTSVARITGSGHTAVYLSRVCAESPIKLRLCRPGELGSVISNYTTLGEDQPFEWNVVPLSVYLYGVDDPRFRPVFGTPKIKQALEEQYRVQYLDGYCASEMCRTSGKAEWREMVAATLERSIYVFVVRTTVEQDLAFIKDFNSAPNVNHFNGVSRNCATFARRVIDSFFPHAAHADYLNDFGMTSPKAIARSFTHYAEDHPELEFHVFHFAQMPGTIKRSSDPRSGTEQLYRSKKLLVPMAIFAPYELPAVAGSYLLTGRFNPERELEKHPAAVQPDAAETGRAVQPATFERGAPQTDDSASDQSDQRALIVGTKQEWKQYGKEFDAVADQAVLEGIIPDRAYLDHFLDRLGKTNANDVGLDRNGAVWLDNAEDGNTRRLGASESNILSADSDPRLAYVLMLARVDRVLKSSRHSRETMPEFKDDWKLLQDARAKMPASFARSGAPAPAREAALLRARP